MPRIPDDYHDLFEAATIAHVVTMNEDGSPHATPVWIDYDAERNELLVNTERHRKKAKNAKRDPRVAASMTDPETPYRYLSVRGVVDDLTTEGARDHIDKLARRYTGDDYATPIQSERVLLRITPEEVLTGG